jgi:S-adenosylmethionine:tRNA ribosyltransferase-isomerase
MRTDELDFFLPPELIAQVPAPDRSASRLLHYRRHHRSISHRSFRDLPALLRPGDLLVFNDARVLPARFMARKPTGGAVEGLFLEETSQGVWRVLLRNAGSNPIGLQLAFEQASQVRLRVVERHEGGEFTVTVIGSSMPATELLQQVGRMPLPPYIRRDKGHDERDDLDRQRYQTVFAAAPGAVAAPTAALHFADALFGALAERGVRSAFVTLNVGMGTFKPVTAERLEDHAMHVESYAIPPSTAEAVNNAKRENRRVIAVGTTSARVLESQPADEPLHPVTGQTGIFIQPGYVWKHVDALVTNFHLPRSTLIAMVAAMAGLEEQRRIYQDAIEHRYRFFSYGDAMLIE